MLQERPSSAPAGSLRELLAIAIPLVLSSGSLTLMHVVDRMFLTWYSRDALAAAMPSGLTYWLMLSIPLGTASYVNSFVAQYEGAGRRDRVGRAVWQGVYFSLAIGVLGTLAAFASGPIFRMIGHAPSVQQMEIEYFAILSLGTIPALIAATLACFYSGRGKTMVIMWVNLAGSLINIGLDWPFIFGAGPIPAGGIRGAAIATVISQFAMVFLYIVLLMRSAEAREYGLWREWGLDRELFGRLLRYGLPNGFHMFSDVFCFSLFILLVGTISEEVLAATNLAFNLNTLAFLPMLGLSTAVMTLVGTRIGEGKPEIAVQTTWMAFSLSAAYMGCFALVYLFLPDLILAPYAMYSNEAEFASMRGVVVELLRFVAIYSLFDAMAIIFSGAIRGAGDTRFSLLFTMFSGWLLMVIPTFVGFRYFSMGVSWAWSMCTLYVMVLGVGFWIRFQRGRWKSMKIIESQAAPAAAAVPLLNAESAGSPAIAEVEPAG